MPESTRQQRVAALSKKRRAQQRRDKLRKKLRYGALAALCFLVGVGMSTGWFHARYQALEVIIFEAFSKQGFRVESVGVMGLENLATQHVLRLTGLKSGLPIFAVSLQQTKEQLESVGWIENAEVERVLPNQILIRVTERKPTAIWQFQERLHLVDEEGTIIQSGSVGPYWELPMIVGKDAHLYMPHLFTTLSEMPDLLNLVDHALWVGARRWDVKLKNGVLLKLPELQPEFAISKLQQLEHEKKLFDRAIKTIDLRLPDRVFIEAE